jgi:hypothetical protein
MTGESLNFDLSKEESKEIRSDRQISGAVTVDANAAGGFNFHQQYAEYDPLIEGAMASTWSAYGVNGVGTTFSGTVAVGSITAAVAPTTTSAFTNLALGQWFKYTAPGDVANDGKFFKVHSVTAPTSTVITLDASTPGVAAGPTAGSFVSTSRISNGVLESSFTIEKEFADVTQFLTFRGMTVAKMNINFASAALTDGSFEFMGKDVIRMAATQMPGTTAESQAYDIQNGVRGVGTIWLGTVPLTGTFIKSLSLSTDNTLRGRKALANLGNVSIGYGDFKASGQMEIYFADGTQYDRFLNDTYAALVLSCTDSSKNGYVFTMPRTLLMNGKVTAGAKNQDIMATFDFTAFADDANAVVALRKTLFIDRVGPAVVP